MELLGECKINRVRLNISKVSLAKTIKHVNFITLEMGAIFLNLEFGREGMSHSELYCIYFLYVERAFEVVVLSRR